MEVKRLHIKKWFWIFICSLGLISCVEEIQFENQAFDFVLVIDATLTDEEKHHQIFINRAHRFEEDGPNRVTGATVQVITDTETYIFEEEVPGTYTSVQSFKAMPNTNYQLQVTTQNGKVYTSAAMQLTAETNIDNLYARRDTNDDGVNGMSIYVDSYDPSNTSKYYRYEFEETFKVVAPLWRMLDAVIVLDDYPFCLVDLEPRSPDKVTCFRTEESNFINIATTAALNEDRLEEHLVRFLSSQNYRISHRYSILVKQYVISEQSFNYWEAVDNFTSQGSIFSQVQAGYVPGNIQLASNPTEKVVGFFDVSTTNSKRIYFNYTDFYQGEPLPPYAVPCTIQSPTLFAQGKCGPLISVIRNNSLVYLEDNIDGGNFFDPGPYIMIPRACGDCTALGQTVPPDFWTE